MEFFYYVILFSGEGARGNFTCLKEKKTVILQMLMLLWPYRRRGGVGMEMIVVNKAACHYRTALMTNAPLAASWLLHALYLGHQMSHVCLFRNRPHFPAWHLHQQIIRSEVLEQPSGRASFPKMRQAWHEDISCVKTVFRKKLQLSWLSRSPSEGQYFSSSPYSLNGIFLHPLDVITRGRRAKSQA